MKPISHKIALPTLVLLFTGSWLPIAQAQSILAAPDGTGTQINLSGNTFNITGGTSAGNNLFHSFEQFGLHQGQIANFLSSPSVQNILGRVTGGQASLINGLIQVTGSNANLYLINPAGMIFGSQASLNVPASFIATTANGIGFGNQWFNAIGTNDYAALAGTPDSFAFTMSQPGAIINAGNLAVGQGQNLILLGGTVVNTGTLSAPGGTITVASVPGEKWVRVSPTGSLLSLDLPLETTAAIAPLPFNPLSLPQLLTGGQAANVSGVTVNPDGTVSLTGSGVQLENGDVVAVGVLARSATLSASHNLTLIESQLQTTEDLNLIAGDTLRIRDSATHPFIAQAGGQLYLQGNQSVDIFALNHPASGLLAGGDLLLRSDSAIGGDAHFSTGGNFRIKRLDGSPGSLFSPHDPVIRASGDVSFDSYIGPSLHILAGGSVTISGSVVINNPEAAGSSDFINETITLSDGTSVAIDGSARPTLDIRAGTTAFGTAGIIDAADPFGSFTGTPNTGGSPTGSNITIGSIQITAPNGMVLLTNRYQPNQSLTNGTIQVNGGIDTSSSTGNGGAVYLDSRNSITTGAIDTQTNFNSDTILLRGGAVRLLSANAGSLVVQSINTSSNNFSGGGGQGGDVVIRAAGPFRVTGYVSGSVPNSTVFPVNSSDALNQSPTGSPPPGDFGSGVSINTSGNVSSEDGNTTETQPRRAGIIDITYGSEDFVVGGVGFIPDDPNSVNIDIVFVQNFAIPQGASGTVGAIVARNSNAGLRVVFRDQAFISFPEGATSSFNLTSNPPGNTGGGGGNTGGGNTGGGNTGGGSNIGGGNTGGSIGGGSNIGGGNTGGSTTTGGSTQTASTASVGTTGQVIQQQTNQTQAVACNSATTIASAPSPGTSTVRAGGATTTLTATSNSCTPANSAADDAQILQILDESSGQSR